MHYYKKCFLTIFTLFFLYYIIFIILIQGVKTKDMNLKRFFKLFIYTITMISTIVYIIYRLFFTLPFKVGIVALIFGSLILLIEIWEAIDFFIYYMNILLANPKKMQVKPKKAEISEYPDIDVFIATYNEAELLLKHTIESCLNMRYPDKSKIHIYLCDDGNRYQIKDLADKFGINYISRITNKNFKAGNYNNALNKTFSPYIVTFDADMAPTPDFLEITLPYILNNDKVGFVQLPQSFNNPDIFQYRFGNYKKVPFEQEYFYNNLQIAKNASNSTVYCGTNTIFSRKALSDAKGFAYGTLSEDIATGMLIEAKGYKGIALNDIAAYGKSVNDFDGFIKQRSRWARGCIQMLKNYRILGINGLNLKQKLEYLSCVSYWFFGVRRMVYLLAPILFTLFGIVVVDCNLPVFLSIWLPAYLLKRFVLDRLEGNKRSSTWSKIYETILTPVLSGVALRELFGLNKMNFEVSPKGNISGKASKQNKKLLFSHLILLLLNLAGFAMCFFRVYDSNIFNYTLSFVWTLSNIFYLSFAIVFDSRTKIYNYEDFEPNKAKKYSKLSILITLFNKRRKETCIN